METSDQMVFIKVFPEIPAGPGLEPCIAGSSMLPEQRTSI